MLDIFKNILKNKKGITTIETAIITMVILVCISGMIDLNTIIRKFNATSSTASYISRTVGKQGGVRMNKPQSFNGDYITSQELFNDVKSALNHAGIEDTDWKITINGTDLTPSANLAVVDHGSNLTVQLTINYKWKFVGHLIGDENFTKTSQRIIMSTFKNRTSTDSGSTIE